MKLLDRLKKNKRTFITGLVVIAFGIMLYSFMNPKKTPDPPVNTEKLVQFEGTKLEETKDGHLVWQVTADKIMVDPETQVMYFTNPKALLISDDGTELTLTSPRGSADRGKQTLTIEPPIQAQTNRGDTLQTAGTVYYNMNTHLIKGGQVVITRADTTTLKADAFETNTSLDHVSLTGHAQVTKGDKS